MEIGYEYGQESDYWAFKYEQAKREEAIRRGYEETSRHDWEENQRQSHNRRRTGDVEGFHSYAD